jgi:hypothetical protein
MPNAGDIDIQMAESLQILKLALNDLFSLSIVASTFTRAENHWVFKSLPFTTDARLSAFSVAGGTSTT